MSMYSILVVDDETDLEVLIKQKFRKEIRQKEYEFLFAVNGRDALEKIQADPEVDVVLSDINMPEMDGLTLLTKLSELSPLIKSVIVSAYGDMENIRTAMNRGAFDFITKPINTDALEIARLSAVAGAFPLVTGSGDAALLARLEPGNYTAQVNGAAGETGVALLEIYEAL